MPIKLQLKVSTVLKDLLKQKGETISSLSKATGVPKSTIGDWMASRVPNPVQAALVANHFGVGLHYFLFGVDDLKGKSTHPSYEEILNGRFEISIRRVEEKKHSDLSEGSAK